MLPIHTQHSRCVLISSCQSITRETVRLFGAPFIINIVIILYMVCLSVVQLRTRQCNVQDCAQSACRMSWTPCYCRVDTCSARPALLVYENCHASLRLMSHFAVTYAEHQSTKPAEYFFPLHRLSLKLDHRNFALRQCCL